MKMTYGRYYGDNQPGNGVRERPVTGGKVPTLNRVRIYAVRWSSRPWSVAEEPYRDQKVNAPAGFDTASGLPFDKAQARLNQLWEPHMRKSYRV